MALQFIGPTAKRDEVRRHLFRIATMRDGTTILWISTVHNVVGLLNRSWWPLAGDQDPVTEIPERFVGDCECREVPMLAAGNQIRCRSYF